MWKILFCRIPGVFCAHAPLLSVLMILHIAASPPPVLFVNSAQLKLILVPLMVGLQSGFYSFGFFDLNQTNVLKFLLETE